MKLENGKHVTPIVVAVVTLATVLTASATDRDWASPSNGAWQNELL